MVACLPVEGGKSDSEAEASLNKQKGDLYQGWSSSDEDRRGGNQVRQTRL